MCQISAITTSELTFCGFLLLAQNASVSVRCWVVEISATLFKVRWMRILKMDVLLLSFVPIFCLCFSFSNCLLWLRANVGPKLVDEEGTQQSCNLIFMRSRRVILIYTVALASVSFHGVCPLCKPAWRSFRLNWSLISCCRKPTVEGTVHGVPKQSHCRGVYLIVLTIQWECWEARSCIRVLGFANLLIPPFICWSFVLGGVAAGTSYRLQEPERGTEENEWWMSQ